jgi:phage FluMu protein Com
MAQGSVEMKAYRCPTCNYLVSEVQVKNIRFDFFCPRCKMSHISDFKPVPDKEELPRRNSNG